MATSYFRERARNPYLRRALTPSFEDDPNVSPTFDQPARQMASEVIKRPDMRAVLLGPPPSAGIPGGERAGIPGVVPAPEPAPPPRDPIEDARAEYTAKVPQGFGGRFKDALLTAGLGALKAAASDRENPLGAAIGGAIAGGGLSAVSPKTGRAFQFETIERPRIEDKLRREEEQRKKQQAAEERARAIRLDDLKRRGMEAEIAGTEAQTKARGTTTVGPGATLVGSDGKIIYQAQPLPRTEASPFGSSPLGIYNKKTGEVTTPAPEKTRRPPDAARSALKDVDEMKANANELWAQVGEAVEPEEKMRARNLASAAQEQYNQSVRRFGELYGEWFETGGVEGTNAWGYIKARRKSDAAKPKTGSKGQPTANLKDLEKLWDRPGGTGISRPRSQFNSSKFPGLRFE